MTTPEPSEMRARVITTPEGRFIHIDDFKAALSNADFVEECAAMLVIACECGHGPMEGIRRAIGSAIYILSGDEEAKKTQEKTES